MIEIVCKVIKPEKPVGGFDAAPIGSVWSETIEGFGRVLRFVMSPNGKYCLDQVGVNHTWDTFSSFLTGEVPTFTITEPEIIRGHFADWSIRGGVMYIDNILDLRPTPLGKIASKGVSTQATILSATNSLAMGAVPSPGHFLGEDIGVQKFPFQYAYIKGQVRMHGGVISLGADDNPDDEEFEIIHFDEQGVSMVHKVKRPLAPINLKWMPMPVQVEDEDEEDD